MDNTYSNYNSTINYYSNQSDKNVDAPIQLNLIGGIN